MMNWLRGMEMHDFSGERAKEQWEKWENERKRKNEENLGHKNGTENSKRIKSSD